MKLSFSLLSCIFALITPCISRAQQARIIRPGDSILIEITGIRGAKEADCRAVFQVLESGKIKIPALEQEVLAKGLTPAKLARAMEKAFSEEKQIPTPSISAILPECCGKAYETPLILISGQVSNPGEFPLREGMTLLGAIGKSGGFSDTGDWSCVRLKHLDGQEEVFDLRRLKLDGSSNPLLLPGDSILVKPIPFFTAKRRIP